MQRSSNHHFLIGYRYPPRYWPQLVEQAKTVAVLADGDGIVKQVEHIHKQNLDKDGRKEIGQYLQEIPIVDKWWISPNCHSKTFTNTFVDSAVAFQINAYESQKD